MSAMSCVRGRAEITSVKATTQLYGTLSLTFYMLDIGSLLLPDLLVLVRITPKVHYHSSIGQCRRQASQGQQ